MTKDASGTTPTADHSIAYYVATTIISATAICGLAYCGTTPNATERKENARRDFILECVRLAKPDECEKMAGEK